MFVKSQQEVSIDLVRVCLKVFVRPWGVSYKSVWDTLRLVFKGFGVTYFLVSLRLILDKCTMILSFYFAGLSDLVR